MPVDNFDDNRFSGVLWTGESVSFSRSWGGVRFTDEQCESLLAGQEILLEGFFTTDGHPYSVKGRLAVSYHTGKPFWSFDKTEHIPAVAVPTSWCQHVFTDEEKSELYAGHKVLLSDCVTSKGVPFSANVSFTYDEQGIKRIIGEHVRRHPQEDVDGVSGRSMA